MGCPIGRPPTQPPPRSPVGNAVTHRPDLHGESAERNTLQLLWCYWVSRSSQPDNERFLPQPREQSIDTRPGVTEVLDQDTTGVSHLLLIGFALLLGYWLGEGEIKQAYKGTGVPVY